MSIIEKEDIAIEVRMRYPFNKELKGWRVIDTPGIGANWWNRDKD